MPRRTIPLDQWMGEVLAAAFTLCEDRFAPVDAERKEQNLQGMTTSLRGNVPKRFLQFLETTEDPRGVVEDALENIASGQHEYPLYSIPGKFTKDGFLQQVALQTVSHILVAVFGPPTEQGLKFSLDIAELYAFLKQKTEQALATRDAAENGNENGVTTVQITLKEEEKETLIRQYATARFSVHAFLRKIPRMDTQPGQYI